MERELWSIDGECIGYCIGNIVSCILNLVCMCICQLSPHVFSVHCLSIVVNNNRSTSTCVNPKHDNYIQGVCSFRLPILSLLLPMHVLVCKKSLTIKFPSIAHACLIQLTAGKWSFTRLAIIPSQRKTQWCCYRDSLAPKEVSIAVVAPTPKVNRSNLSSSFRLGCQLQADICKCKS